MHTIHVADEEIVSIRLPSNAALELTPELAILSLLEATLLVAIRALASAHPEIGSVDDPGQAPGEPPAFPSASACTADSIITHLDAVRFGIESYRRSITREMLSCIVDPKAHQDIHF